jgi:two-component system CheB/CheR fusion protein
MRKVELSIRAARRRPPGAAPAAARSKPEASRSRSASRIAELERELEAARTELENSKAHAEADNRAKSRSLSAASHDLRQPLQTLEFLQSLLANAVGGDKAVRLVKQQNETLSSISGMLGVLDKIAAGAFRLDLVIADDKVPDGVTDLQVVFRLHENLSDIPVVIQTGDDSTGHLQDAHRDSIMQPTEPVDRSESIRIIDDLQLQNPPPETQSIEECSSEAVIPTSAPVIFVVDDDAQVRVALRSVLEEHGWTVEDYAGSNPFLAAFGAGRPGRYACLLVDAAMPDINGLELLEQLKATGHSLPVIVITGQGDVAMAVRAMKAGALDFIEKPVHVPELLASVAHALDISRDASAQLARHVEAEACLAKLTPRQLDVMAMVLAGHPSKNIAADLGISQRTVENHRASIMRKTGARSLPALARLALAAAARKAA